MIGLTDEAKRCGDDPAQYDRAEALLAEALSLAPDNETVVQNYVGFCTEIGGYHLADGQNVHAIRYFTRALKHARNHGESWLDLGTAYARSNQLKEALHAWHRALEHLPDDPEGKENIDSIAENFATVAHALKVTFSVGNARTEMQTAIRRILENME